MTNFTHNVTLTEANTRVDQLLTHLVKDVSRAQIQAWIKLGLITVNEKQVKANYRVQ